MTRPDVEGFFDEATNTVTYVVSDPETRRCVVIDPVLDFDAAAGRTSTASVDAVIEFIEANGLQPEMVLETHAHADHLSAAQHLIRHFGIQIAIGRHITDVQRVFSDVFNLPDLATDGSQFNRLFANGDTFKIGSLEWRVMHTPGHTPACLTYVVGDAAFVGDTLFMPDYGTARCDFPGGDAGTLYDSIQRILDLPDDTRLFMCHDYKAPGREVYAWESSVSEQRSKNIHLRNGVTREEFVRFRNERDATLSMPKLILPSIQVNIRAGKLPTPESNDISYLKLPLNAL